MTINIERVEDIIKDIKTLKTELKSILDLKEEETKLDETNLPEKLRKKIIKKKKKLGPELKKHMTSLLKYIDKKNLNEIMKSLNTLKSAFPQSSFNRLLLDYFSYAVLCYGYSKEFSNAFENLDSYINNCSQSLDNFRVKSIQEMIDDTVKEIKFLVKDKSLNSSNSSTDFSTIKDNLNEIKTQLTLHPVFSEQNLQDAFDTTLKNYMKNLQQAHERELKLVQTDLEKLQKQYQRVQEENDRLQVDLNEMEKYNIQFFKEFTIMKNKYQAANSKISLINPLLEQNNLLQKDVEKREKENNKLQETIQEKEDEIQKYENNKNQLENENIQMRTKLDNINNQLNNANQENNSLKQQLTNKENEYNKLKTVVDNQTKELDKKNFELKDISRREKLVEDRAAKVIGLEAENIELQAKVKSLQQNSSKPKQDLSEEASSCHRINKSHSYSQELADKIVYLQKLTEKSMGDIPAQKLYIAEQIQKQLEIKKLLEKIDDLENQNNRLEGQIDHFKRYGNFDEEVIKPKQYKQKITITQK